MTASEQSGDRPAWDWTRPSIVLGLATLTIHLIFNGGYGIFRDELYFIVCGDRLAWGYVDQPPLVPIARGVVACAVRQFAGRLPADPALAMSATVALTAEFARAAGRRALRAMAGGLVRARQPSVSRHRPALYHRYFPAAHLAWLAAGSWCAWRKPGTSAGGWPSAPSSASACSANTDRILCGGARLSDFSRRRFAARCCARGSMRARSSAFFIVLPNVLWQQAHGWPFLELGKAAVNGKNVALSPVAFFVQQLLLMGPLAAPVWLAGLWACCAYGRSFAVYRAFPIAYVILFAFFVITHGKAY